MKTSSTELLALLDKEEIIKLQESFHANTGVSVVALDTEGKVLTKQVGKSLFCGCMYLGNKTAASVCRSCFFYGAKEAKENGRGTIYYCPMGLIEFSAPIIVSGQLIAYLIGGMVFERRPAENQLKDLAEYYQIDLERIQSAAEKTNVLPIRQLENASVLLFELAGLISKNAEARLQTRLAQEELERASQMKNDFLANMSHELRTPMNAVIGMAEIALREKMSSTAEEYVQQIQSSGKSLLHIINDILDYSKISSGKLDVFPEEYNPEELIRDVTTIITNRLQTKNGKVMLLIEMDPGLPKRLVGDAPRLQQIMINLLNNAVKFTNQGQITLQFNYRKLEKNQIKLSIQVKDTGIGIRPEDIKKLFKSFSQVDSKRNRNVEGTGLGLAIVQQLVELMGGEVSVESTYGEGSTFSFYVIQEIADSEPICHIPNPSDYAVSALIDGAALTTHFNNMADSLGITSRCLTTIEENVEGILEKWAMEHEAQKSYLFVDEMFIRPGYIDMFRKLSDSYKNLRVIIIINPFSENHGLEEYEFLTLLKKPLYTIDFAKVLLSGKKKETITHKLLSENEKFVAPTARVLVVDDNSMNLRVAEKLLNLYRIQVDKVSSGVEAVDLVVKNPYDIIFMDHMMPGLDGIDTTRIIRRFHPKYNSTPIIALTANAMEDARKMFLSEGMQDFVAKPIEMRILQEKLLQWLPAEKIETVAAEDSVQS